MAPPTTDCLIIGCGYLGRQVAAQWVTAGRRIRALTRRNAADLAALGIEPILGDVLDPASLRNLPQVRTVLHAVGLDRTAGKTMHEVYVHGLAHVLDTLLPPERFVYVSSTGVYGQTDGGWVTEDSVTEPAEESGRVVLEAERFLRSKVPGAITLRFAGIYGPGRLLRRQQQLMSGEPQGGDPDRWLNLIHVEDGVEAVLAAEQHGELGETFNVVDDEPVSRRDFYTHLSALLHAPPPRFEDAPEPGIANRRVSNRKLRAALRWAPRYPSYREGLRHC